MKQLRKRLTYANVMSSIAVFVVLGGAAVAASQLPKNSVGTKQLKKNAVTGVKVKNGSLKAADFQAGQLPAGPKGEKGEKGEKGATGPVGPSDVFAAEGSEGGVPIGATATTVGSINLPAGSYQIFARASLQGEPQIVRCNFAPAGLDKDAVETTQSSFQIEVESFDVLSLSAPTTVAFQCKRFGTGATAYDVVLTAIRVGSITT